MGNERYNAPAPHERTLPHVPVNEQGLRELEIWLLARLRKLLLQQVRSPGSGWRFNVQNGVSTATEKGYGYVQFTGDGIDLDDTPDPLAAGGVWGGVFVDDSGQGLLLGSTFEVFIKGRNAPVEILADGQPLSLSVNGSSASVNLETSGDTFAINDHLGAPLVTFTG